MYIEVLIRLQLAVSSTFACDGRNEPLKFRRSRRVNSDSRRLSNAQTIHRIRTGFVRVEICS